MENNNNPTIIQIGCNYHSKWQSNKARLITRNTGKDFWTNIDDLIFITSRHNTKKAERLKQKQ